MKKTMTQTQSVTTTQMGVATLALFVAGGIALVAAPVAPPKSKILANPSKSVQSLSLKTLCGNNRQVMYNSAELVCKGGKIKSAAQGCRTVEQSILAAENFCVTRIPVSGVKPSPAPQPVGEGYGYNAPLPPAVVSTSTPLPNLTLTSSDITFTIARRPFPYGGRLEQAFFDMRITNVGAGDLTQNERLGEFFATYVNISVLDQNGVVMSGGPSINTYSDAYWIYPLRAGESRLYRQNGFFLTANSRFLKFVLDPLPRQINTDESNENDNELIVPIPEYIYNPQVEDPQVGDR